MWCAGVIDCNCVQYSLVIDTQPCLQLTCTPVSCTSFVTSSSLSISAWCFCCFCRLLASNCQSAAAAIVVCIAARVLNKMLMITTVRVSPDSVGWRQSGEGVMGYSYIRGPTFFLNRGPAWSKSGPAYSLHTVVWYLQHLISLFEHYWLRVMF